MSKRVNRSNEKFCVVKVGAFVKPIVMNNGANITDIKNINITYEVNDYSYAKTGIKRYGNNGFYCEIFDALEIMGCDVKNMAITKSMICPHVSFSYPAIGGWYSMHDFGGCIVMQVSENGKVKYDCYFSNHRLYIHLHTPPKAEYVLDAGMIFEDWMWHDRFQSLPTKVI